MEWLAQALNLIMEPCYQLTGNWWVAIFLFTVIAKIILLPMSLWCQKNSIVMVQLMPDLNRIKVKFYGDREAIGDKQNEMYKAHHYHPLLSLVPLAIQILILFGLIDVIHGITDYGVPGTELLGMVPFTDGGISWLMPVFAGLSAIVMGFAQNRINPLQREQSRAEKNATNGLSIGLSFFLGIFVATGMGFYWVCSNLISIGIQALCNVIISPKKHIDYADLEASHTELADLEALDTNDRKWYQRNPLAKREKADFKRFFKTINKHIVFFSESSGFYRYFQGSIEWLLENSDATIHYVTNDPNDKIFELAETQPRIQPYYIGPKRIITLMMKMDAPLVVATLEDLDTHYIKRSYVRDDIEYAFFFHHMTSAHMTPTKTAFDGYDTILCVGQHQINELRKAEKLSGKPAKNLVAYGYDLLDQTVESYRALDSVQSKNDGRPTVLIGPSWQEGCILDSCIDEVIASLRGHGYRIIVRPHPEYTKRYAPRWEAIIARHADIPEDEVYFEQDFSSNESVFSSDILITDWSSVAYEFSFATNKPSIFINTPMKVANPDYEELDIVPTDISLRDEVGVSFPLDGLDSLAETVTDMLSHQEKWRNRIAEVAERTVFNRGNSAEVAGEYLLTSILNRQNGTGDAPRAGNEGSEDADPQAVTEPPTPTSKKKAWIGKTIASHAPEAIIATLIAFPFMAQPAYAYVDPSVMTYTIQALAGVAVALSAVLGVVFRKTRRKLFAMLNIDENARKVVEPNVHRVVNGKPVIEVRGDTTDGTQTLSGSDAAHASDQQSAAGPPSANRNSRDPQRSPGEKLRWRARFGYALLASVFLSFTLFVVAPFEIVAANASSLHFGLGDVGWYMVGFATTAALALALLLTIAKGRGFTVIMFAVIGLAVGCYMQALFLNQGLPTADGSTVTWGDHGEIAVISTIAWVVLLSLALLTGHRLGKRWRTIGAAIALVLIIVQGVGVVSIIVTPLAEPSVNPEEIEVTEDGLFDLSSKNNVVVFVLDTFDTNELNQILADHPKTLKAFENFTLFENSTGSMIPTRYAVPFLATGEAPQADQDFEEYYSDRYGRSTFMTDIYDANYSIGIYSDSLDIDFMLPSEQKFASQTVNLHSLQDKQIDALGTIGALAKCALYRDMPWLIKPWFWYYTDEINNAMTVDNPNTEESIPYRMDDAAYAEKLESGRLSVVDDDTAGAFRFIHLQGAHQPYILDENGKVAKKGESTFEKQARGSLHMVSEYLDEMKELGIYDSSTIVVTADHGYWYSTPDDLSGPTSPIMLVKPETSTENRAPIKISDMPISHMDFQATIIDAIGGDSKKYGETVFEVNDPNRKRLYYMTTSNGRHDTGIKEMEISGDVLDFSTWHPTGKEWPIKQPEE